MTDGNGSEVGPAQLREVFHALSSDDRDERRDRAATPGAWWRDGALDPDTAAVVGTALIWCTMVDDDAGGVRADMLGSLATLARDGRVPEEDLDRLVTGLDAQSIPETEHAHSEALRAALGRDVHKRRDPKGYLHTLVDHVHALTAPDAAARASAVSPAEAELGIAATDRRALAEVSRWATA
jgi:hypothetical protein